VDLAYEFLAETEGASLQPEAVEEALRLLFASGRETWRGIDVPAPVFARHLGSVWSPRVSRLENLRGADLYLACACAAGDPRALAALEPLLAGACTALPGGSSVLSDEVRQELRERLLVADRGAAPLIATYSGEGALTSWLKVIAVRAALRRQKSVAREVELDPEQMGGLDSGKPDPELDYLKLRHGEDFRAAFKDAAHALPPRDRTLLRLYYADGLGVERIGSIYQVHPSTASRWLQSVREALLLETRRLLGERLKLTSSEVESLLGLLRSGMQASLRGVLTPSEG
jgi:RNA polymerase sigma-70 factor (ECF subfamily)